MKIVHKTWGCEIWWANTDKYMGKTLIITPDCSTSLHYHEKKDETILVIRGTLVVIDETMHGVATCVGASVHIPPNQKHKLQAGVTGLELIEVSTPHPDDSVRVSQ